MKSIFSNLPNNIIIDIIKIAEDERKKDYWKWRFSSCMYELQYEYNVKEDWEMDNDYEYIWTDDSSQEED
tara:strand:- start:3117 stop:3326 length:210 start_codon:yes stop_codon:yes gene_type:complete